MALRELNEDNEISKMVLSLSSLLRQSLETENAFTTLKEEVVHAKEYINIQKYRYNDKFNVEWHIDRNCLNLRVVKIMLQPLLENSIYHGIKPLGGKGLIKVKACIKNKNLVIEVKDNGVGMDAQSIVQLNEDLDKEYIQRNSHIGLVNVNQRVKLLFGEEYGMEVASSLKEAGIKVTLTLPLIPEKKQ
jgi:two-component system sensor histidine kinase YesM